MVDYTKEELKFERDKLQDKIALMEKNKVKSLDDDLITLDEFREINGQQLILENKLTELNVRLIRTEFNSITVSNDSPGAKLKASIASLQTAIDKLDDVKKMLVVAADVINALDAIIVAIASIGAIRL